MVVGGAFLDAGLAHYETLLKAVALHPQRI